MQSTNTSLDVMTEDEQQRNLRHLNLKIVKMIMTTTIL